MNQSFSIPDPFPASEFDEWANQYDEEVQSSDFPFTAYWQTLSEVVNLANAAAGMSVLDLGTGTSNLSAMFASSGCELWCTDFSAEMLKLARLKLPLARFFLHDLRQPFPEDLPRCFDRIVSAYVFHHFELPEKVALIRRIIAGHLAPAGRLVIADISFQDRQALDAARLAAGEQWSEEPFWVASEVLPAMQVAGLNPLYRQVSACSGVYCFVKEPA